MLVWRTYSIEIVPYYQTMNEQLSMHSAAICPNLVTSEYTFLKKLFGFASCLFASLCLTPYCMVIIVKQDVSEP